MTASIIDESTSRALDLMIGKPDHVPSPEIQEDLGKLDLIAPLEMPQGRKANKKLSPLPVRNLGIFVTQECNMKCVYCYGEGGGYGSGGHMESGTALKAVDWLIGQSREARRLNIIFFGGEPLLNFPLIEQLVEYAVRRGTEAGKKFAFNVTTNATLLDDEKISFFKNQNIDVLVSFDGPREVQDAQRPFKNGRGSYDFTLPKIKKLLKAIPETSCRATLLSGNDPAQIRRALYEIGFSSVLLGPVSNSLFDQENGPFPPARDIDEIISMLEAQADAYLQAVQTRSTEKLNRLKPSSAFPFFLQAFINHEKKYFPCGAGLGMMAMSVAGDFYPCHRFVGNNKYRLGSIFEQGLNRDNYEESPVKCNVACKDCFAKYVCGGGCRHDHAGVTGSVSDPAGDICQVTRRLAELAAAMSCSLDEKDRDYLVRENIIAPILCPLDL